MNTPPTAQSRVLESGPDDPVDRLVAQGHLLLAQFQGNRPEVQAPVSTSGYSLGPHWGTGKTVVGLGPAAAEPGEAVELGEDQTLSGSGSSRFWLLPTPKERQPAARVPTSGPSL